MLLPMSGRHQKRRKRNSIDRSRGSEREKWDDEEIYGKFSSGCGPGFVVVVVFRDRLTKFYWKFLKVLAKLRQKSIENVLQTRIVPKIVGTKPTLGRNLIWAWRYLKIKVWTIWITSSHICFINTRSDGDEMSCAVFKSDKPRRGAFVVWNRRAFLELLCFFIHF